MSSSFTVRHHLSTKMCVKHPPSPLPTDRHPYVLQSPGEGVRRALYPLLAGEDRRLPHRQGPLQRHKAAPHVQRVGKFPGEPKAAIPVHDRHQGHQALRHRTRRDLCTPSLVGAVHLQPLEPGRRDLGGRTRRAQARPRDEGLKAPRPHQSHHPRAVEPPSLLPAARPSSSGGHHQGSGCPAQRSSACATGAPHAPEPGPRPGGTAAVPATHPGAGG